MRIRICRSSLRRRKGLLQDFPARYGLRPKTSGQAERLLCSGAVPDYPYQSVVQFPALRIRICRGSFRRRKSLLRDFPARYGLRLQTFGQSTGSLCSGTIPGVRTLFSEMTGTLRHADASESIPRQHPCMPRLSIGSGRITRAGIAGLRGPMSHGNRPAGNSDLFGRRHAHRRCFSPCRVNGLRRRLHPQDACGDAIRHLRFPGLQQREDRCVLKTKQLFHP